MPDRGVDKAPTWVKGLDSVLGGGVPADRTTLVCGGAGCGKTVLAMEFVARAAAAGEPGVFVSFEQTVPEIRADFASFDLDPEDLEARGAFLLRHVAVDTGPLEETGDYSLDGLLVQLDRAIDEIGAGRVALDTPEALFGPLRDTPLLRSELRRLFRWLQEREVTTLVTSEAGDGTFTRHGLEEYVSDCVIHLDHRVEDEVSTRRARIVKYRGSDHSADEHPFLIDERGISLIPITSAVLRHDAPVERVSTGLEGLDALLEGGGYYRAASVLVSGTAGTGKSSIAASFVDAACARGEPAVYLSFEESPDQILRNMSSVGIDLGRWLERDLLHLRARRPSQVGLEQHLLEIERLLDRVEPTTVAVDPCTNLINVGTPSTTRAMLTRLVDALKTRGVTTVFTALGAAGRTGEDTGGVSSLMDTWIALVSRRDAAGRKRGLYIVKSRGMGHSGRTHELHVGDAGLELRGELPPDPGGDAR